MQLDLGKMTGLVEGKVWFQAIYWPFKKWPCAVSCPMWNGRLNNHPTPTGIYISWESEKERKREKKNERGTKNQRDCRRPWNNYGGDSEVNITAQMEILHWFFFQKVLKQNEWDKWRHYTHRHTHRYTHTHTHTYTYAHKNIHVHTSARMCVVH